MTSYSLSGVPGVGSRFSQNVLAKAARSSSVLSALNAFSSSSLISQWTGPLAQSFPGVFQSGGPAAPAALAANTIPTTAARSDAETNFIFILTEAQDYSGNPTPYPPPPPPMRPPPRTPPRAKNRAP